MQEITWSTLKRIAADQVEEISRRAVLLERIDAIGPVGRRTLAASMQLSEREVRAAAEALREEGLITLGAAGMKLAPAGIKILPEVRRLCRSFSGLHELEAALKKLLPVKNLSIWSAEEAFSVYDHPPVWIFKKSSRFDLQTAEEILDRIDLTKVVVQGPRDATWPEGYGRE